MGNQCSTDIKKDDDAPINLNFSIPKTESTQNKSKKSAPPPLKHEKRKDKRRTTYIKAVIENDKAVPEPVI